MEIRISLICLIALVKTIRQLSDIRIRFVGADINAAIGLGLMLVMDAGSAIGLWLIIVMDVGLVIDLGVMIVMDARLGDRPDFMGIIPKA